MYTNFNPEIENIDDTGIRVVAIYAKESEICVPTAHNDHIWGEIKFATNTNILCGCVYRSPSNHIVKNIESTTDIQQLLIKASKAAN